MAGRVGAQMNTDCRHPGCDKPSIERANYCQKHLMEPRRCKAKRRHPETGQEQRCKAYAMIGLEVCNKHGGNLPGNKAKSERSKALSTMQRFVKPYEGDIDPVIAFEQEFRRTLGRIAWYDEQLAELKDSKDLIWGLTKAERISAAEYPGTNKTYEARVNILEELQRWERKHLLDLEKVWIGANLEERHLNLLKAQVELGYAKVIEAITRLGIDAKDSNVRRVLAEVFMEGTGPDFTQPEKATYEVKQIG